MSVRKAQSIVNEVDGNMGISLVAFRLDELEYLKSKLEEFLELEIDTDELQDSETTSDLEDLED